MAESHLDRDFDGLPRLVEDDRYCVDVLTQINAVCAALHKVEEPILRNHVMHCVADAFASGDLVEQRHKIDELVETIGRMTRSTERFRPRSAGPRSAFRCYWIKSSAWYQAFYVGQ